MKQAKEPFQFVAASYLIRICRERAKTLGDMARSMRTCSEASIFYHTFQSLETHHYSTFSSDFAQWILAACNEAALAERLATVDLREFVSLAEIREALASKVEDHILRNPASSDRLAFEPFHFCEVIVYTVPLDARAQNLAEFAEGVRRLSLHTLHHHFITSRLRLRLQTNDFSYWVEHSLELPELGQRLDRIDFYNNTLESLRGEIVETLQPWMDR